ncbi:hypothetical protein C922_03215 [Plasmodium inui San Antonio 1]|uniref:Uncharacterized protein n=1 Tax=Plasmodium inui San Antonio 1 TaxID=1237626 RepID=W7AB57_9APIC|nr:hypothetical protein C922_03215 [Plasmodium inui San Antonio 1]EUD66299.1 hypothetical protein C922_03215 [Plasmodium inui San Antonio 1]
MDSLHAALAFLRVGMEAGGKATRWGGIIFQKEEDDLPALLFVCRLRNEANGGGRGVVSIRQVRHDTMRLDDISFDAVR